jgi:membrane-bound lytic murein transglycosylase D
MAKVPEPLPQEIETPPAVELLPEVAPDEMTDADPVSASPLDDLAEAAPEPTAEELARAAELTLPAEPTFDIPIEINDRVRAWIDRYSRAHKTSFEAGMRRSGRYMARFREIFAEEGVPQDVVYMAHVESGFKTSAYSRAHARGIFQFISGTARRYGLRVDYWADERADPEKSARAAARYMKDLYDEFGDWYLAFAGYNAGEGKIRRAIARTGKRDFWSIARTRYIRRETKNHIPAILAATLLYKEPHKYDLDAEPDPPLEYETITVDSATDLRVLAKCAGSDLNTMRELNPALRRNQTPPRSGFDVQVPRGTGATAQAKLQEIPVGERVLYARHRVRRGDTLSGIARSYGVTVSSLQQTNGMSRRTMIRINQMLLVPTSAASRYANLGSDLPADVSHGQKVMYSVRRGDTLYGIARRYDTTARDIAEASGIAMNKTLSIGERLTVVPGLGTSARAGDSTGTVESLSGALSHTVRRGDTLWRIASLYRTTVNVICSLNGITPNTTLYPGVKLTVRNR